MSLNKAHREKMDALSELLKSQKEGKKRDIAVQKTSLPKQTATRVQDPRKVFVVYGRNLKARKALFEFLRAIDLRPMEWSEIVAATGKGAPYIGEILDKAFFEAQAVVVLMTPDDEGCLRELFRKPGDPSHETEPTPQARLNVLFEAGMAMGHFPERTILVELGVLRPFSDIGGRHVVKLDDTPEKRQELAQRLKTARCAVDLSGTDWHTAGNFEESLRDTLEKQKEAHMSVEIVFPHEVDFRSFDKSFKALKEATQPKTKAAMLSEFKPKLHSLCYNSVWSDETKGRIVKVLKYIPKELSDDPNIDSYLRFLGMIINRHGEHTISMVKERFLVALENLYNDPSFETNIKTVILLQKLHGYSEDYIMKLVDDAVYWWSDSRFDVLWNSIEFWELRNRDDAAYERVLKYLRRKMDDAERSKDEKTYARFKKLYALAKG